MNRKKTLFIALFTFGFVLNVSGVWGKNLRKENISPHTEALQLLFSSQQKLIQSLDKENRQVDTEEREWIVKRPIKPGVLYNSNYFLVMYQIDHQIIGKWTVNIESKEIIFQKDESKNQ